MAVATTTNQATPKADPHPNDNLGEGGKKDDHTPELETAGPEVLGGPEILPFDGMNAGGCLHHHGEERREEDQKDGRAVSHPEPQDGYRDPRDGGPVSTDDYSVRACYF
jgi:hypothetical protein